MYRKILIHRESRDSPGLHLDNATNFVGTNRELGKLLELLNVDSVFQSHTRRNEMQWRVIPPRSPHMGTYLVGGRCKMSNISAETFIQTPLFFSII